MYGTLTLAALCGRLSVMSAAQAKLWTANPPDRRHSQRCDHPSGLYARASLGPRSLMLTLYDENANPALSAHVFGAHAASADLVQARLQPRLADLAAAAAAIDHHPLARSRALTPEEAEAYRILVAARSC